MKPSCKAVIFLLIGWLPGLLLATELRVEATRYRLEALLTHPALREVEVADDAVLHRPMRYRALPLDALLPGLRPGERVQFIADDGFVAEIEAATLMGADGRWRAWLAVEDPTRPWPRAPGKPDLGPFYLVWTDPGDVGPEQWPYRIVAIRRREPQPAPVALSPDPALPAHAAAWRGFAVFQRNCLACHTLNGAGAAQLGPDLNVPHNPTEYLPEALLRAYLRDPQSLHRWPQARMRGFSPQQLSDADLDALLAYLRHMAGRKRWTEDARP